MARRGFKSGALRYVLPMMRGAAVRDLQQRLIDLNHLGNGELDGLFGPRTRAAVRRFQNFAAVNPSGVVDEITTRKMVLPRRRKSQQTGPRKPPDVWDLPFPAASPKRIILHWTGGGARASDLDKRHYHFLVEQDGTILPGTHSIAANDRPVSGRYAAHTLNLNTKSVGVALCGMTGAQEKPFRSGRFPFRQTQLQVLTKLVAQICNHYDIPVSRTTVLGHGEVQDLLGVAQNQKWDPLVLPWQPELSFRAVGDRLRAMIAAEIDGEAGEHEPAPSGSGTFRLKVAGVEVPSGGVDHDCASWAEVKPLCKALGWEPDGALPEAPDGVSIVVGDQKYFLPVTNLPLGPDGSDQVFVKLDDLVEELDLEPKMPADGTRVELAGNVGGLALDADGNETKHVTVRRGDTLRRIALRELGGPDLWTSLTDSDGRPFDLERAKRIRPGDVVVVPMPEPREHNLSAGNAVSSDRAASFGEAAEAAAILQNRAAARKAGEIIATACMEHGIIDLSHIAYIFATAQHETNFGRLMVEKWTNSAAQLRYETNGSNSKSGDGKLFLGRGYVQLTFRENYRKFAQALKIDLENDPDQASRPDVAAKILALGMDRVGYRHPRQVLSRYGFDGDFDFVGARAIVNADVNKHSRRYGTTRGRGIARYAEAFRRAFATVGL